jgi:RND family efflux transporter MFP subunit
MILFPLLITVVLAAALAPLDAAATDTGRGEDVEPLLVTAAPAMREVALIGFTRARAEQPLVSETDGRVQEIFLDIGQTVDDRARFAQLDTTFVRLDIEEVGVQQDRLRSQVAFDEREVTRIRELVRQNSASASQLDALEQALRDNNHALRALDVKRRILEERLARATIAAPVGSRVTARLIEVGQWVRAGETVGRAGDFSTLLVPFALTPEQFAALENAGEDLHLELLDPITDAADTGGQDTALAATVHRVNPGFDPETRKIAVELAVANGMQSPRGGLRTRLRLLLPEASGAVSLPPAALGSSYEEAWIIREDGERLPVLRLGPDARDPGLVRVVAPGLKPGDRVRIDPEG